MNRSAFFLGLSGVVVTLSAIEAAATGSATIAAALGGTAMAGASTVAKDLLKDRFKGWVKSPPEDPGKLFANDHLSQLIGEAIQAVLTRERDAAVGSFQVQLDKLLKPVVGYWQENCPRLTNGTLEAAHAANLTEILHRQIQGTQDFPLATPEAWGEFLRDYAQAQDEELEDEPRNRAAARLHRELGHVLYEKAKQAAEKNPRAAAAIQLQFQSWLLQGIAELHENVRAGFAEQTLRLATQHSELLVKFDGVAETKAIVAGSHSVLLKLAGDNEETKQTLSKIFALVSQPPRTGEDLLPPLMDRLHSKESPGEFVQLIEALLAQESRRAGWEYRTSGRISPNTTGIGTEIRTGKPLGFNPPVWIGVESLTVRGIHGPIFSDDLRRLRRFKARNEVANCVVISPVVLSEADWKEAVADGEAVGTKMHNFTQPEFESWLRKCPPLLARYYPEVAARLPGQHGFAGCSFKVAEMAFLNRELPRHRDLRLLGLPPRYTQQRDESGPIPLRKIFVPQRFRRQGAVDDTRTLVDLVKDDHPRVLLGDPGSGKTTILHFLALLYAGEAEMDGVTVERRVPLFLPLRDFSIGRRQRPRFAEAFADSARQLGMKAEEAHPWLFESLLLMGEAAVLLDGLDEAGDDQSRAEIADLIEAFRHEYPACPLWVTTRIVGYAGDAKLSEEVCSHFELEPFRQPEQTAFIRRWYELQLPHEPELRTRRTGRFLLAAERTPGVLRLAGNPLLLTLMALVHHQHNELPRNRGELYQQCVEMLLKHWQQSKHGAGNPAGPEEKTAIESLSPPIRPAQALNYLAAVALDTQVSNEQEAGESARGDIPGPKLRKRLEELRARVLPDQDGAAAKDDIEVFLRYIRERSGLLFWHGKDTYAFAHLSFLEYLAAYQLANDRKISFEQHAQFFMDKAGLPAWRESLVQLLYLLSQATGELTFLDELMLSAAKATTKPPAGFWRALGIAVSDELVPNEGHIRTIMSHLLDDWKPGEFSGDGFEALAQICSIAEPPRVGLLQRLLEENWRTRSPEQSLLFLHLRIRLLGWPSDLAESGRLAGELTERLGGLESPPSREHGLSSPLRDSLPLLLHTAELLADAGPDHVSATEAGAKCVALVRMRLQTVMEHPRVNVKDRAAAGISLSRVGDLRLAVMPKAPFSAANPLFAWCELKAAGPDGFSMGEGKERFRCTRVRSDYRLARYPVTVAQYALFVAAGGYGDPKGEPPAWWAATAEWQGFQGWDWVKQNQVTGPENASDPVFQTPNHPRIGVSWYEAVAFGRWLNQHFTPEQLGLPVGWQVRLPTEAEWEYAASAGGTRRYPWGDETDFATRCNCVVTGLDQTSAVGLFPAMQGAAACGAEDMAGNVWEWGASHLRSYQGYNDLTPAELDGMSEDGSRVVRGGSWGHRPRNCRAASPNAWHPGYRSRLLGFRLAAGPELQSAESLSRDAERPEGPERRSRG